MARPGLDGPGELYPEGGRVSLPVRKIVRDAVRDILADATYGFNPILAATAADYAIEPWVITYDQPGGNFFQGFLVGESAVEMADVLTYPAQVLYTTASENIVREKGRQFSGAVAVSIDNYIRFESRRDGVGLPEPWDADAWADCVEDVLIQVLHRRGLAWPTGVSYGGKYQIAREPIVQLPDGWAQRIPMQLAIEVNL